MKLPTLKLGHQGSLIVLLLLMLELVFVQQYSTLLDQAEGESRNQQKTKEIIQRASDLLQDIYDAGDSIGKFALYHTKEEEQRYFTAVHEIPITVSWLKSELRDNPEQMERLNRVDENITFGLGILRQMKAKADADPHYVIYFVQWVDLQPKLAALVRDLKAFLRTEREKESFSPEARRAQRQRTKNLLVLGGTANVAVALLLAVFFVGRLRSRLNVVVDNSRRLKDKQPLLPPMQGQDEIAEIDSVFHHMVNSLRGEEELLKRSEQQMRSMIESIPVGLVVVDADGNIEFANAAVESILGFDRNELIGRSLASLFSNDTSAGADNSSASALISAGWFRVLAPKQVIEVSGTRKDGTPVHVELSSVDASAAGVTRQLAMIVDVSERHKIQSMRKAFVAMVSHELRTPLTSVGMFLEMLDMEVVGKKSPIMAAEITRNQSNVAQLILLITDLLDLEKTEADKMPLTPSPCVAEDIIDKAIKNVGSLLDEKDARVHFEGSEADLFVDVPKITKAVTNLLSAAIRLSPEGGLIEVEVTNQPLTEPDATPNNESDNDSNRKSNQDSNKDSNKKLTTIEVRARQVEVPDSQLEYLFERFQQVETSGTKHSLGLGLALCQAIVKRHGGTTSARALPEGGIRLLIHLP